MLKDALSVSSLSTDEMGTHICTIYNSGIQSFHPTPDLSIWDGVGGNLDMWSSREQPGSYLDAQGGRRGGASWP